MTDLASDVELEPPHLDDSDDDFQYEEVEVVRYDLVQQQARLQGLPKLHGLTTLLMLAYSVGDDNLIGEDLDSALRSLQNLTVKVFFLQHV